MRKDPAERYPSIAGLVADLKHFKRKTESGLVPVARARRSLVPALLVAGGTLGAVLTWTLLRSAGGGTETAPVATAQGSIAVVGFELSGAPAGMADGPGLDRVLTRA